MPPAWRFASISTAPGREPLDGLAYTPFWCRPRRCQHAAAAGSGPAAAFRGLGGTGVVGVVLRVAEFDCVLQLVDPRVGEVRDLRDGQKVIAAECGSTVPVQAAAEKAGDVDAVEHAFVRGGVLPGLTVCRVSYS